MADTATRVQTITANLEQTFQNLRLAARNISGLLATGKATCDEVQAYNVWALATYQAQIGMANALQTADYTLLARRALATALGVDPANKPQMKEVGALLSKDVVRHIERRAHQSVGRPPTSPMIAVTGGTRGTRSTTAAGISR